MYYEACSGGQKKHDAFTLVELLVVLALVSVLLGLMLPSYRSSVLAAGRAEARQLLLKVAVSQEQFYSANNRYSTYADPLQMPPVLLLESESGRYQVSVSACEGASLRQCFRAMAVPKGAQMQDSCGTLTLDSRGFRGASATSPDGCWP